jgi:HAD superfamily hydrolase (TIGR01509 family)
MEKYTTTLFDMDGVLVETATLWQELEHSTILPAALEEPPAENPIRALSVADAYETLAERDDTTLTVDREEFEALYCEHAPRVYDQATLLDGFEEIRSTLNAHDHHLGLVSASRREWVEIVCDRFDLWDTFDVVVSSTDIEGPSKPSPHPYEQAAEQLDIEPDSALVIEDSPHGIEAATAAGMDCIALRGAGNRTLDLSAADAIAETTTALQTMLKKSTMHVGQH